MPASAVLERGARVPQLESEQLLVLSQHLSVADRALIRGVYERGMSLSGIAAMSGRAPSSLRTRLRRIHRRLSSPMFRFVVQHLDAWAPTRRAVAEAVILKGQSQRLAAELLNLTRYQVRLEVDRIRVLSEQC